MNWKAKLKEAKELFDDGLLDEAEYKAEKARIMAMRAQSTNPSITGAGSENSPSPTDTLMGSTVIGSTNFGRM